MRSNGWVFLTLLLLTLPAYGDFSIGAEYSHSSRDVKFGSFEIGSAPADGLGAFLGFNWKSSVFYVKHFREDTQLDSFAFDYQKRQTSFDWHWNRKGAKEGNFLNTSFGIFHAGYAIGPGIDHDFLGLSAGGGLTRFIAGPVFINGRIKVHLFSSLQKDDLFETTGEGEDASAFFGYEAQAALGFQFGRKTAWSLQVGYKFHDTEFHDRFIDDTSQQAFVVMRFFAASKDK